MSALAALATFEVEQAPPVRSLGWYAWTVPGYAQGRMPSLWGAIAHGAYMAAMHADPEQPCQECGRRPVLHLDLGVWLCGVHAW